MREITRAKNKPIDKGKKRGLERQRDVRTIETQVKRNAVALSRWLGGYFGKTAAECASLLGISESTLKTWTRSHRKKKLLKLVPRGRRPRKIPEDTERGVKVIFGLLGACTSVAKMREYFPEVPAEHLEELRQEFKCCLKGSYKWVAKATNWKSAGTVWAMDFTKPPEDIDGRFCKILVVRDLASGKMLAAMAVEKENSMSVIDLLIVLFQKHGAPLVIKSDNGSPFISYETCEFLRERGVLQLFSPPVMPTYNAAVESGIGSLKM